jgi:hypothetical protein
LFSVFDRFDRRETLMPVTPAKGARKAVVMLKTQNQVCHREAAMIRHLCRAQMAA